MFVPRKGTNRIFTVFRAAADDLLQGGDVDGRDLPQVQRQQRLHDWRQLTFQGWRRCEELQHLPDQVHVDLERRQVGAGSQKKIVPGEDTNLDRRKKNKDREIGF